MRGVWRARSYLWELRPDRALTDPSAARGRRTLLSGWFTFGRAHATAGDLYVRDLAEDWLRAAGHEVDVANLPPFAGGVDWRRVDPLAYDHVVFACGPFHRQPNRKTSLLLKRFAGARWVGLNLTMIEPLEAWNPFDLLWERDSSRTVRPDVSMLAPESTVPVVGVCLVEAQREHSAALHELANAAIDRLTRTREMAVVAIDTRLDRAQPLRTPGEIRALIARMDTVITTRLHGTVLAITGGVPPLVIDPIAGGAKVARQADRLGWPIRFTADALDDDELGRALSWCLTEPARERARRCRSQALADLGGLQDEFVSRLARSRRELDARSGASPEPG